MKCELTVAKSKSILPTSRSVSERICPDAEKRPRMSSPVREGNGTEQNVEIQRIWKRNGLATKRRVRNGLGSFQTTLPKKRHNVPELVALCEKPRIQAGVTFCAHTCRIKKQGADCPFLAMLKAIRYAAQRLSAAMYPSFLGGKEDPATARLCAVAIS